MSDTTVFLIGAVATLILSGSSRKLGLLLRSIPLTLIALLSISYFAPVNVPSWMWAFLVGGSLVVVAVQFVVLAIIDHVLLKGSKGGK